MHKVSFFRMGGAVLALLLMLGTSLSAEQSTQQTAQRSAPQTDRLADTDSEGVDVIVTAATPDGTTAGAEDNDVIPIGGGIGRSISVDRGVTIAGFNLVVAGSTINRDRQSDPTHDGEAVVSTQTVELNSTQA